MRQYCQGVHRKPIVFEGRGREHWNQMQWTTATNFATTTNSSSKQQQQLQQQQYVNTPQSSSSSKPQRKYMSGIYKYTLVRRAAAYSINRIYQVKVRCCITAGDVHVTNRETKTVISTHSRAAAAAAAALCMHIKRTSRLIRRHLNHHRTYVYTHWNKQKRKCAT